MTKICDPLAGWAAIGHIWYLLRGAEDASVEVELIDVSTTQARVKICCSFRDTEEIFMNVGDVVGFWESTSDTPYWTVVCHSISKTMASADIEICYEEAAEPIPCSDHTTQTACEAAGCYWYGDACHNIPAGNGYELPLYGSTTVLGHKFTNTRLLCATAQAVIRPEGLAAKTLTVGGAGVIFAVGSIILPGSIVTTGVIMGGIYMSLREIDAGCTKATVDIFNAAYTEEDHVTVVTTVTDALVAAGVTVGDEPGDDFTPEEVDNAVTKAEENVKNSKEEKQRQEDVKTGVITPEEAEEAREIQIADEAMRLLFEDNFSLDIPTFVMAGEVQVSGSTPKQNQDLQIMGVKKLFGFDWLASDMELAKVTSDADYTYEATLTLEEFGIIEVYARIPKDWWDILDADIKTTKHTVFVLSWTVILFLIIAAALVYDKSTGKLGLLKGKKRRK